MLARPPGRQPRAEPHPETLLHFHPLAVWPGFEEARSMWGSGRIPTPPRPPSSMRRASSRQPSGVLLKHPAWKRVDQFIGNYERRPAAGLKRFGNAGMPDGSRSQALSAAPPQGAAKFRRCGSGAGSTNRSSSLSMRPVLRFPRQSRSGPARPTACSPEPTGAMATAQAFANAGQVVKSPRLPNSRMFAV